MKRLKLETESICLLAKFLLICTFISLTFIKCIGLIELLVLDYCGYYVLWIGLNLLVCLITLLAWLSDCVDFDWLDCVKWVVLVDCVHSFDCVDWIDWSDRLDHIDLVDSIDCLDLVDGVYGRIITVESLYSGHYWFSEEVSAIERCPLWRGAYIVRLSPS